MRQDRASDGTAIKSVCFDQFLAGSCRPVTQPSKTRELQPKDVRFGEFEITLLVIAMGRKIASVGFA